MASRLELRTEQAMKAAWERAAASQERTVSDWARRVLNDAAGYHVDGMRNEPVAQTPPTTIPVAACVRASTHRRGVYCKACGRTP